MWFKSKHEQLIKNIYDRKIFIIVADRLDESLLVLGKLVGLKMTSLLYASQKVLASKNGNTTNVISRFYANTLYTIDKGLDKDISRDLDNLQPYDLKLYKAANSMLDCYIKDYHHHHEQFEDDLYSFRIANERVHSFCQMVQTNNNINDKPDTKLHINTTTIGDKRVRYREYCQRLYSDNDEAINQIWKWKENVKRNISGTNYYINIILLLLLLLSCYYRCYCSTDKSFVRYRPFILINFKQIPFIITNSNTNEN